MKIFRWIFILMIVAFFVPIWWLWQDVLFDKALFVTQWTTVMGSGFFMAFLFYFISKQIENEKMNKNDKRVFDDILMILRKVHECFSSEQKDSSKILIEYKMIPFYINMINNNDFKLFINKHMHGKYQEIESNLINIKPETNTVMLIGEVNNLINNLSLWKKNL